MFNGEYVRNYLFVILFLSLTSSCTSTKDSNLPCDYIRAEKVAGDAIKEKYPEHYEKYLEKGFSTYFPTCGGFKPKPIKHDSFALRTILNFKENSESNYGNCSTESILVLLSNQCVVLSVEHSNDQVQWVY